tara:strand:- start:1170 stop:1667 length:498 start_codon:yes stop_codon:yes gene_type:complete
MSINYPEGWQDYPSVIIQCVTTSYWIQNETQISGNNYYNWNTVNITPKSTNSRLIVMSTPRFYTRSADRSGGATGSGNTNVYIQDVTNNAQTKAHEWLNYADSQSANTAAWTDGLRLQYPIWAEFSNTVTTQRQFRTRAYVNGSSRKGRVGGEFLMHQIIWEMDN